MREISRGKLQVPLLGPDSDYSFKQGAGGWRALVIYAQLCRLFIFIKGLSLALLPSIGVHQVMWVAV